MAFFTVTSQTNQTAIINSNAVTKVIDFGTSRTIYQGSDENFYKVKDTLATILTALQAA